MRTTNARSGLRALSAASLLIACSSRPAESSPITSAIGYSTTGAVESGGMAGSPLVSFQGVGDGSLTTGGTPFDLGRFVVGPPSDGTTTTYQNTPFEVSFLVKSLDGVAATGMQPAVIQGWLNGTVGMVDGRVTSHLVVNFNGYPGLPGDDGMPRVYPSIAAPFVLGGTMDYLGQADGFPGLLSPGVSTDLQGVINSPQIAPEPGTLVIFACLASLPAIGRLRRAQADSRNEF